MCGEKHCSAYILSSEPGSPPRVRGKAEPNRFFAHTIRITPACAGKRSIFSTLAASNQDHPRVCGEKPWRVGHSERRPGSPPRVRGKVSFFMRLLTFTRITPACAGKSFGIDNWRLKMRDHPRVCGEKRHMSLSLCACQGSPPRVRGKVENLGFKAKYSGITPACAGKSGRKCRTEKNIQDHPRVCGEKYKMLLNRVINMGSPPRVRGKAALHMLPCYHRRITPACAGKSDF